MSSLFVWFFWQADIAPLMASLIGVPIPVNSVVSQRQNQPFNGKCSIIFQVFVTCFVCICFSGRVTSSLPQQQWVVQGWEHVHQCYSSTGAVQGITASALANKMLINYLSCLLLFYMTLWSKLMVKLCFYYVCVCVFICRWKWCRKRRQPYLFSSPHTSTYSN